VELVERGENYRINEIYTITLGNGKQFKIKITGVMVAGVLVTDVNTF